MVSFFIAAGVLQPIHLFFFGVFVFIPIPNPVRQFWPVNLFFVLLLVVVKRLNRCRLTGAFHLVDLALTAVFGIYGFIAVLIFPNRY